MLWKLISNRFNVESWNKKKLNYEFEFSINSMLKEEIEKEIN